MTRRQSTVFGEVAALYHQHRPAYPDALFEWIAGAVRGDVAEWRVLDVGMGTGKSSAWFLERGAEVVGIEPDAAMAAVATQRETGGRLTVAPTRLEDWDGADGPFDLAVSGQAWHWAEPATRFDDVADALTAAGRLCVFWNRPELDETPFAADLTAIYETHASEVVSGLAAVRFPGSKSAVAAATPAEEFDHSGRFGAVEVFNHRWTRTVTTADHCANLLTQSDHRMLDPAVLEQLLAEIAAVIDAHGGAYDQRWTTHAYAATRRN